jgi:hypothetical protein
LSREKPLAAKYCHCTTCQRLHGVRTMTRIETPVQPVLWRDATPSNIKLTTSTGTLPVGRHLPQIRHQLHKWPP